MGASNEEEAMNRISDADLEAMRARDRVMDDSYRLQRLQRRARVFAINGYSLSQEDQAELAALEVSVARDLPPVRAWYEAQRARWEDPEFRKSFVAPRMSGDDVRARREANKAYAKAMNERNPLFVESGLPQRERDRRLRRRMHVLGAGGGLQARLYQIEQEDDDECSE